MKIIRIGKIGSTYGVRGWIKIQSYTEYGANILDYSPWYLSKDQQDWRTIEVEDGQAQANRLIVKFKNIDTPEKAALLTNSFIGIDRAQLPELKENEYYWSDLEGLTVIDQHGKVLGVVRSLLETGSNDVLVVKGEKEHAIPYLFGKVILQVDLEKREIHVNWEVL